MKLNQNDSETAMLRTPGQYAYRFECLVDKCGKMFVHLHKCQIHIRIFHEIKNPIKGKHYREI